MKILADIGTLTWTRRTNGIMTRGERARYISAVLAVQARATPPLVAARLGWRARRRARLDDFDPPDSTLARETIEACLELMPRMIVEHSLRSFLYARALARRDRIEPDEEVLFVATMLHDAGAMTPDTRDGGRCFTLDGAERAERLLRDAGYPEAACEAAAGGITLHVNPTVSRGQGLEPHALHEGVLLDAAGLRAWQIERETIHAVRRRHPRLRFSQEAGALLRAQARAIPGCRIAAAYAAGFGLALRIGPWRD
jgi:hypothetical protein